MNRLDNRRNNHSLPSQISGLTANSNFVGKLHARETCTTTDLPPALMDKNRTMMENNTKHEKPKISHYRAGKQRRTQLAKQRKKMKFSVNER